uniref:Uncharacterized protein n=1 Tax=Timema monikensis TaxID=170555 RepID=A0A7R9E2E8_9NEOP|nr:unnamed protein product [Timema monikensis]
MICGAAQTVEREWLAWELCECGGKTQGPNTNIAVCRSYLSAATTLQERTGAVSMVSLAQVLGFVVGPGLQTLVTPLGDQGVSIAVWMPTINMYTAAGWINVLLGAINFILFLPAIFKERRIAAREAMLKQGVEREEDTWEQTEPDYLSTWTLINAFFIIVFNFVLLETVYPTGLMGEIGVEEAREVPGIDSRGVIEGGGVYEPLSLMILATSLTMDQFAWSKEEALYYMGLVMSAGAVIACATFLAIGPLCKRVPTSDYSGSPHFWDPPDTLQWWRGSAYLEVGG